MIRFLLTLVALLCAAGLHAHPGHSPLEADAAHQLTHLDQWLPLVLFIVALALIRFVRRKKL
jgi:hypothetical protein